MNLPTDTVPVVACPCGTGSSFDECCGPVLAGVAPAATAEALMRSRFTAFSEGDVAHLEISWDPDTRPDDVRADPETRWVRLEIVDTEKGRQLDNEGIVEFRAHWEQGQERGVRAERSWFRRVNGRWVFVSGV